MRGAPPAPSPGETLEGPAGLGWMMATHLADGVWAGHFGRRLTLSHRIPRNELKRDRLERLAGLLVEGGWSLEDLLVGVASDPLFNLPAPAASSLDSSSHPAPPVWNPWSPHDLLEERQGNSVGDVVARREARSLLRNVHLALEWGEPHGFPPIDNRDGREVLLQESAGAFLKSGSPPARTIGFQSLLGWEIGLGTCRAPNDWPEQDGCAARDEPTCDDCGCEREVCTLMPECCSDGWTDACAARCSAAGACGDADGGHGGDDDDDDSSDDDDDDDSAPHDDDGHDDDDEPVVDADTYAGRADWIDALLEEAAARDASWADVAGALRERLLGDAALPEAERPLIASLLERSLSDPASPSEDDEEALRRLCGVWLQTPEILISGLPRASLGEAATLRVPGDDRAGHCARLAPWFEGFDCASR